MIFEIDIVVEKVNLKVTVEGNEISVVGMDMSSHFTDILSIGLKCEETAENVAHAICSILRRVQKWRQKEQGDQP